MCVCLCVCVCVCVCVRAREWKRERERERERCVTHINTKTHIHTRPLLTKNARFTFSTQPTRDATRHVVLNNLDLDRPWPVNESVPFTCWRGHTVGSKAGVSRWCTFGFFFVCLFRFFVCLFVCFKSGRRLLVFDSVCTVTSRQRDTVRQMLVARRD